jgi:hypothetical protein
MRFMNIVYANRQDEAGVPPTEETVAAMGKFIEQETKSGVLVSFGGLAPSSMGKRVSVVNGNFTVTDGPFSETKEIVGGFAIIEAPSIEEAIEASRRFFAVIGDGEGEIRPMF